MPEPGDQLRLESIAKAIGGFRLEASFQVSSGERLGIVGRSGSGKTSLLRIIAGLDRQDSGRIWLGGSELTAPPEKRAIGFVFQEPALFPSLDVEGNAAFGLVQQRMPGTERARLVEEWLARVGLAEHRRAPVQQLSGGERQRLAFVRALIWKPRLLLLDEPFSALDPALRADLRSLLLDLHRLCPVPMILVSHDEADLAVASRRIEVRELEGGKLRSFGP